MAPKESKKITDETEVGSTELAVLLGLTARRVQQLAQDGIIVPVRRGRFNLCEAVKRYINYISKEKNITTLENEKQDAEVKIKKAKAIVAELEAEELRGKMHRSEDVAAMTEDLIYTIRGALLALPGRLAVDVVAVSTAAETAELIRKEVYAVMKELSEYRYDPQKYEERVRERRNWEAGNKFDDADE